MGRWIRGCVTTAALGGLPILAAPAAGAEPEAGVTFMIHHHQTKGAAWHVEIQVSRRDRGVVRTVVLYDEHCDETIAAERVRLTPEGLLQAGGEVTGTSAGGDEQPGSWELQASFPTRHRVEGSFRMTEPDCEATHTFDGSHRGHGGGHDHGSSDPYDYPDIAGAKPAARSAARRVLAHVRAVAARRFATIDDARAAGFNRYMVKDKVPEPGIFHLWSRAYNSDATALDPERPESLVYWKPTNRRARPVLLAFMLRLRPGPRPSFLGTIPSWHTHRKGGDQMTHVWLARNLRGAYANCMPVPALERSLRAFDFEQIRFDGHESQPCVQVPAGS